jgi:class 3 adenylate cyclase/tetratricopeptide (TPR) repeat protein
VFKKYGEQLGLVGSWWSGQEHRVLSGIDGVLRLAVVMLEAFSGGTAVALSGFGVAFLIGFGPGHAVLLRLLRCLSIGEGWNMDFYAMLDQVLALLRQRGRVSYRALKRQFDLDDAYLDDLKMEILEVHQCAVEQEGTMLVWTGDAASAAAPAPVQAPAPLAYTPPYLAEKILTSRNVLEGERKQVTVLFADLKDSTELIQGLDPEAAQQLLDPALHRMMAAVHRFEGTVNQVLGDGIMALFGAPIAHEDHALRACYAALAMQTAMQAYTEEVRRTRGLELRMRVGLNSGEVVVRAIGNDLHMDYSAVGETTVLAARMEQTAMPGTTRLTTATLRLVEGLVHVNALGPVPVKGLSEPVEVFELVAASGLRQRLQAAAARGLTPFVGRQHELEAIHQALARAQMGHGQVVALVGEAGVGKSRLVHECIHSHRTQDWRVLESASVSYGRATPYFPIIDLLKRYCHVDDGDDVRTIRAKVTGQVLTLDETFQDIILALLALLDAVPDDSPFLHLDPPQRRQRTLEALRRVLLRESQVQPLLLVFEDLHWIDTETQVVLDRLVESLPTANLLLLVNYRPEYQHGWGSKTYYTQLRLDPLPPTSAEAFLAALLGNDLSLTPLTPLLIARTEGNPFFLEESVRTLVETGVLVGTPGAYRLVQPLQGMPVPATVQAVLAARIDRLAPEDKRLLQTAAVIGHEVPFPLLQAIAEMPEETLQRGLAHLQAAEFLYETCLFPEREDIFKHALTHEVAYGGLLQERRRTLHARIVETIEALAPDHVAEQVERLAHHALRGEVWDKALTYCQEAGSKALQRSALQEARTYFEQALSALQHLPTTRDTCEQAITLQIRLRHALFQLGDLRRVLDHLRDAERLAESLDDQRRLGQICTYLANILTVLGEPQQAVTAAQRALALATPLRDQATISAAHLYLSEASLALGDYRQAIARALENVGSVETDLGRPRAGLMFSLFSRSWLLLSYTQLGEFAAGLTRGEEAFRIAEALDIPFCLFHAHFSNAYLYLGYGEVARVIPLLERGLALIQDANIPAAFPMTAAPLGYAYALVGRLAEALPLLERAVQQGDAMGLMFQQALVVAWLSEMFLRAGRIQEAISNATHALQLARRHQERGHEAYALRLHGDIAAHRDLPERVQAETYYHQALALAEELGMRPLQAHCHLGLGTLYIKIGQRAQARIALTAAIALYRAMTMTFWLLQAEAALAQVEG